MAKKDEYGHEVNEHGEPFCTCGQSDPKRHRRCYECYLPVKPREQNDG
jgi:hypothetical protein